MSSKSWVIKCPHCRSEAEWGEPQLQVQHLAATAAVLRNPANARALLDNYTVACPKCDGLIPFEPRSEYRRRKAAAVAQRIERLMEELKKLPDDEGRLLALAGRCGATVLQVLETDMPLEIIHSHEDKLLDALAEEIRGAGHDPKRHRAGRWLREIFDLAVSDIGERDDLPEAEPDEATEKRDALLRSLADLHGEKGSAHEPAREPPRPARTPRTNAGERHRFELAHPNNVEAVAISRDGRLGLSVGWDDAVKVWDLEAGRVLKTLAARGNFLTSVCFLGDESRVAAAGSEGAIWIWDLASGRELHCLRKHSFTIFSLAASADGRWLVSGSGDGTARLWDAKRGTHERKFGGLFGGTHDGGVSAVALSPDGQWALTGGGERADTVKVWNTRDGQHMNSTNFPDRAIKRIGFLASGWQAVVQSGSKLHVLDITEGKDTGLIAAAHDDYFDALHVAPGGLWASASAGGEVCVIEINAEPADRIRRRFSGHQPQRNIYATAITPDGRRAISGSDDLSVIVWDTGV
jgi:WD40 repeat protein